MNRWTKMPDSAKAAIAFVISSFMLKGLSFVTTPIFTRLMDASQYGITSTFNSWMTILEVFALLGLTSAGVFNVGLNDYRDNRDSYVFSLLCLCNLTTVVIFVLIFAAKHYFGEDFLLPVNQLWLMFIWLIISPAKVFWITRQRYEFKYKLAFCITITTSVLAQIIPILVIKNTTRQNLGEVRLWAQLMTSLLAALPIYIHIVMKGKGTPILGYWKKVLVFALPLIPHYLAQHIASGADRIMLSEMVSSAAAGIYSVVNNIGLIASIIWNSINASLVAYTFESIREKNYDGVNRVVTLLLLGYAVVCVTVSLAAPDVMRFLAPPEYFEGVYAVPPILCVSFLSALYNVYANIEFYNKKTSNIASATIISTVVNIALNLLLIPRFSFTGAAYTTLISYVVLVFLHYRGYKKCKSEQIYNNRNIFIIAICCVATCVSCSLLYLSTLVRYMLIVCVFILFVWKRKFIIEIVKSIKK